MCAYNEVKGFCVPFKTVSQLFAYLFITLDLQKPKYELITYM